MKVLITGGAGYIGSTVAWMFIDRGHKVTIIDNLITGKKTNLPKKSKFIKSDISDLNTLRRSLMCVCHTNIMLYLCLVYLVVIYDFTYNQSLFNL